MYMYVWLNYTHTHTQNTQGRLTPTVTATQLCASLSSLYISELNICLNKEWIYRIDVVPKSGNIELHIYTKSGNIESVYEDIRREESS